MATIRQLHPRFMGEVRGFEARRTLGPAEIAFVEEAIGRYGVLVFKDQVLSDDEQVAFSENFGVLHRSITAKRADMDRRLAGDVLSDISNVGEDGGILPADHMRRLQQRANLLWHTDNSFRKPAGRYTLLNARIVPPADGETEFADTRAAYDALPELLKARIELLCARHALAHSRMLAGTGGLFDREELARFPSTVQPLVRRHEHSGRPALYIGSHAESIVGLDEAESQALLDELLAFATRPEFVYRHCWEVGDLVMWDNRATLHRALPFDDARHRRDLRRTATMVAPEADVGLQAP